MIFHQMEVRVREKINRLQVYLKHLINKIVFICSVVSVQYSLYT